MCLTVDLWLICGLLRDNRQERVAGKLHDKAKVRPRVACNQQQSTSRLCATEFSMPSIVSS